MKKQISMLQILIVSTFCMQNSMHAKSTMPKLSRLRDKVDNAVSNQETFSLKDILKQADGQNLNGQPLTISGPTKANPFGAITSAREPNEFEIALMLGDIKKQLKNLLWSNDTELVITLNKLITQNKQDEAHLLLAHKIIEKHGQDKIPLFAFINKIQEEEQALVDFTTQFFNLLSKSNSNKDQINALLTRAQELKNNLAKLTDNTIKLLLG